MFSSSSAPPSKRAKVAELSINSKAVDQWLADADVPHVTLGFLKMSEMCEFRATCSAAKAAVAAFDGELGISASRAARFPYVANLGKWRRCFPAARRIRVLDKSDSLEDGDLAFVSGAVASLSVTSTSKLTPAALSHLVGLEELTLARNPNSAPPAEETFTFTPDSLAVIASSLKRLTISGNVLDGSSHLWSNLSVFSALEVLELSEHFMPTPAMFAQLPALKNLAIFADDTHDECFPSPECWPAMGRIESLVVFVRSTGVKPFATAAFRHLTGLKRLRFHVYNCSSDSGVSAAGYNAADFAHLAAKLEELELYAGFICVDDAAIEELAKSRSLKQLRLGGQHRVSSKALGKLQSLQGLGLSACKLPDGPPLLLPAVTKLSLGFAMLMTSYQECQPRLCWRFLFMTAPLSLWPP